MTEATHEKVNSHGHEPIGTDVRAVWKTGVVIVAVVAVSFLLIVGILSWFSASKAGRAAGQAPMADRDYGELPPLRRLRTRESQILGAYEWVDKEAQVARIPIERAMEIVAEVGVSPALEQSQSATQPANQEPDELQEAPAESGGNQ
jgi:hypothetical protein